MLLLRLTGCLIEHSTAITSRSPFSYSNGQLLKTGVYVSNRALQYILSNPLLESLSLLFCAAKCQSEADGEKIARNLDTNEFGILWMKSDMVFDGLPESTCDRMPLVFKKTAASSSRNMSLVNSSKTWCMMGNR